MRDYMIPQFDESIRHTLFPTRIWEYHLADTTILNEYTQKFIDIRENEDSGVYSGLGNWVSPDDLHLREEWFPIRDIFLSRVAAAVDDMGILHEDLHINCMWGNSHVDKSQHEIHHHPNSMFSGVFYLNAPEGSGDLFFTDPRGPISNTYVFDYKPGFNNFEIYKFKPTQGKIFIFPSWLQHGTQPGNFIGERISLSFNVMLKTKVSKRSIKWNYYD
jgi:uncharacterized protein (TIGR02466 family)